MKLAILGNSHIACLMLAHRQSHDILGPNIEPVFFGAAGQIMDDMLCEGDKIVAGSEEVKVRIERTSGGHTAIIPAEFDAFLLVAMGHVVPLLEDAYSTAVLRLALKNRLYGSTLWRLASALAQMGDKPVLCGHKPLLAKSLNTDTLISYDTIMTHYEQLATPANIHMVRQPNSTRASDLTTHAELSKGSRRLMSGANHDENESSHMNADYGELYLRACVEMLRNIG